MIYAFIDSNGIVVQSITGSLTDNQVAGFLRDYGALFGAISFVIVGDDRAVWIGGSYDSDSGVFSPPPSPEPEIVEGTSEEIIEEIAEEPTNDAA
jgi:hypothetical protein